MSNRIPPPLKGHRPLLPAPDPRNISTDGVLSCSSADGVDGVDGVMSKGHGKTTKRAKVTAVACQPCQKRKSKCDGQRPVCTACANKRTACMYDSSGDQRRTASLKERIEAVEKETRDLRDIIEAMCANPSLVDIVRTRLVEDNWRHLHELAQAIRVNRTTVPGPTSQGMGGGMHPTTTGFSGYSSFTSPSYHQPGFLQDEAAPSPTATAQSGWSSEVVSGEERDTEDFAFAQDYRQGPPPWP